MIWYIDVRDEKNLSRQLFHFHTAEALEEFLENGGANRYADLKRYPIDIEGIRPYQEKAIEAIETAISQGKRAMLVAMATGTGKTFLTVSQIYRLLQAKCARRVLFLVDRRALAAQAVREFASFNTPGGISSIRNMRSTASASAVKISMRTSPSIPRCCPMPI